MMVAVRRLDFLTLLGASGPLPRRYKQAFAGAKANSAWVNDTAVCAALTRPRRKPHGVPLAVNSSWNGLDPPVLLQFEPGYLRIQASVIRFQRDPPILLHRYPARNPFAKSLRGCRTGLPQSLMNRQQP